MVKTLEELDEIVKSEVFTNAASYWLKNSITTLNKRDIVDALKDIEFLHMYFTEKFNKNLPDAKPSPFNDGY